MHRYSLNSCFYPSTQLLRILNEPLLFGDLKHSHVLVAVIAISELWLTHPPLLSE